MKARYRYRVYPTYQQKTALAQLFGCCRVVWNDALAFCQESYSKGEKYPGENQLQKQFITQAKKTENRKWLKEVSSIALQQSVQDLNKAYQNFFNSCQGKRKGRRVKLPRFKKRKSAQSARLTKGGFKVHQNNIKIAKIGKLKIKWTRPLPNEPTSVTIIKDSADRYFVSFVVEINPTILPQSDKSCGIDLGIIDFATFDDGTKVKAPKPLKKKLKRLRKLQRNLSRKVKGSKRREVARKKVAKLHAKIKDSRTDFLHKLSTSKMVAVDEASTTPRYKQLSLF